MKKQFILFALLLLLIIDTNIYAVTQRTEPFIQEVRTFFRDKDGLAENNIKNVFYTPDYGVVIMTHSGDIQNFNAGKWEQIPYILSWKPSYMACVGNTIFIADKMQLAKYSLDNKNWETLDIPINGGISGLLAFTSSNDLPNLYVVCHTKIIKYESDLTAPKTIEGPGINICTIAVGKNGDMVIGTDEGIYKYIDSKSEWALLLPGDENCRWAPRNVNALTYDSQGNLWFGSKEGVGKFNGTSWTLYTGEEGLPWNKFLSAVPGEKGDVVWFATTKGAIRHEQGKFAYRFSHRWMLDDYVNSIAVTPDGSAWIATPNGLSVIERKPMTFEEKSNHFIQQVETRHNRDGYIARCRLKEPFNTDTWESAISDNDGLYTSMYGAAQAFRYAATKDPKSKEIAKRSFLACKQLVDITEIGMPARVIIPKDWHEPVNELMGAEYNLKRKLTDPLWKQITPRFVTSSDGKYMWKCDTSSDELAGHYFFYGIYYDLVAETEEERQPVREVVKTVTDHLINNDYNLVDHDGKPTRWAFFGPNALHSLKGWEQRGLNSMMMLSFLRVAHHITGDEIYNEKFNELCDKYFYHINAMQSKMYFPPDYVVPWDNNLCLMSWYGIFRYENDAEKLLMWRISLDHAWQHVKRMKNSFWNFLYLSCAQEFSKHLSTDKFDNLYPDVPELVRMTLISYKEPNKSALDHALETLEGIPLDLISYCMDNTHRLDVIFDPDTPDKTRGWRVDGYALPIQELPHVRPDDDPFVLKSCSGQDGTSEDEGTFFLLPFWLGVHHGFIN
ncbi:MAG TPA: two-component regulator propeller domain-containing protein [Candidatus Hydrogenedens sp.]|nr:two-component regulator propeller domain-containing protein [Candidatus Hydrogenedens sp.]